MFQGTNFGVKSHSCPMLPTMGLDRSANNLNVQADIKAAEIDTFCHSQYVNNKKNWSTHPTAPYVTAFGEGLISHEYRCSITKKCRRVGQAHFQVTYHPTCKTGKTTNKADATFDLSTDEVNAACDFPNVPIPLFSRTRIVTVDKNKLMFCSCAKFECRRLFCADQICVARSVHDHAGSEFLGFTHNDVALRYSSAFMHLGYKKTTPLQVQALFHALASKEVVGPSLNSNIPDTMPIEEPRPYESALDRLKNYDKNENRHDKD